MSTQKNSALLESKGLLENLKDNLSGKDGYHWLDNLKKFLRKEAPDWSPSTVLVDQYWKTIQNGFYKSADMVIKVYQPLGIQIFGQAGVILNKLSFKNFDEYKINFGIFTIMDLGFSEHEEVTYHQIVKKALSKNLKQCTGFDGLALRALFTEQKPYERYDEQILVAMYPVNGSIFELANHGGNLALSVMLTQAKFGTNKFGKYCKFIFRY